MAFSKDSRDILFIAVFSTVIFFGAFFLFSSIKSESKVQSSRVSVRDLEKRMNTKINKRIHKLQGKNIRYKSKLSFDSKVSYDDVAEESGQVKEESRYNLDLYARDLNKEKKVKPKTAAEMALSLVDGEGSERQKRETLEEYKREIIEKARETGWAIELDDNLQVINAKEL